MVIKKFFLIILIIFNLFFISFSAPTFEQVIEGKEINIGGEDHGIHNAVEGRYLYDPSDIGIDEDDTLLNNIISLFFPQSSKQGGKLWIIIRLISVGLGIVFLIRGGALLLLSADNESELSKQKKNLTYIFYGIFLFFGSTLILGDWIFIGNPGGLQDTISRIENRLFINVLGFLKAFAYFFAILMMIYYGYKIIEAYEKEDKIKAARNGVINVIAALVFIRAIDFLYSILQTSDFKAKMADILVRFSKLGLYVIGLISIGTVFYAAALLLTSRGDENAWKKAKTIITNIFLVMLLIGLFLLIIYQLINAF